MIYFSANSTQDFNLYSNEVHPQFKDYDIGMEYARQQGMPVMVDFTGYGCVNCRKMEAAVWTDSKVGGIINDKYVLISLQLADMVGMTDVSFGRFFKLRTGKNLSDYIIDIRLGFASRLLVDSTMSIAEICYECGFNNLSNFNRIFKKKKSCSPKEFRENYRKKKKLI